MKVKKILISQPEPVDLEKSPYRNLIQKHGVDITFYKFFEVVGISASDFRKTRIHLHDHTAVIFNSKNSILKFFCSTEAIALYLQKHIQYRKRKVFYGNQYFSDLIDIMQKHRDEKYLFPCSDERQTEYTKALDKAKFKYTKAPMYTSQPRDLSRFKLEDYDIVALFSPIGVRSLVKNFPDIKERNVLIAAFGASTHAALKEHGIKLSIGAPTHSAPSMAMAIENYIMGREPDTVISRKSTTAKTGSRSTSSSSQKRAKPVIANKEIYKQRMEEKKAQAAARRAARAAEKARKEAEAAKLAKKEEVAVAKPVEVIKEVKETKVAAKKVQKQPKVAVKPATKPVAKPAAKPAVKPAAKPAAKATAKPAAKASTKTTKAKTAAKK